MRRCLGNDRRAQWSGSCLASSVFRSIGLTVVLREGWRSGALVSAVPTETADENAHGAADPANTHLRPGPLHGLTSAPRARLDRPGTSITLTFMQQ